MTRIGRLAYDAVRRAGAGRVVSAYARAVNVLLDSGSLVTLLPAGSPMHAWAVGPVADLSAVTMGTEVVIDARSLKAGSVAIGLDHVDVADLTLRVRPRESPPMASVMSLDIAAERCLDDESPEEACAQERIGRAARAFSSRGEIAPLASVVGLGPGLTPSGDDVLMGILAGLDFAADFRPESRDLRSDLVSSLPHTLERVTPLLSAQMLRAASAGRYPEPVVDLAHALGKPDADARDVRTAVLAVQALGHRSGRDILRGFAAAVRLETRVAPAE